MSRYADRREAPSVCKDCVAVAQIGDTVVVAQAFHSWTSVGSNAEWTIGTRARVGMESAPRTNGVHHLCANHPMQSASACLCVKSFYLSRVKETVSA